MSLESIKAYLAERHPASACPCRKRHQPMKFPEAKSSPPGTGKAMARLREGLTELDDASDDESRYRAERKISRAESELGADAQALRAQVEEYRQALADYRTDICAHCAAPLLNSMLSLGCSRCLTPFEAQIAELLPPG